MASSSTKRKRKLQSRHSTSFVPGLNPTELEFRDASQVRKRRRMSMSLLTFCNIVLSYENYPTDKPNRRPSCHRQERRSAPADQRVPEQGAELAAVEAHQPGGNLVSSGESESLHFSKPLARAAESGEYNEDFKENDSYLTNSLAVTNDIAQPGDDSESESLGLEAAKFKEESELSDDDDELITCYCNRPYEGRPMVECSACKTWIHIKCAGLTKKKIPDMWFCRRCEHLAPADHQQFDPSNSMNRQSSQPQNENSAASSKSPKNRLQKPKGSGNKGMLLPRKRSDHLMEVEA